MTVKLTVLMVMTLDEKTRFEDQVQFEDRLETVAYHLGYSNIINFTDSKSLWNLV